MIKVSLLSWSIFPFLNRFRPEVEVTICLTISFLRNEKDYWGAATHSTGSIVTALICIFELGLTTASLNITLTTYRWHILQRFKNFKQFKCILELGHTTMTDRQCHTKDSKRTRFGLTSDQYQTLIVLHPTVEFTGLCNISCTIRTQGVKRLSLWRKKFNVR